FGYQPPPQPKAASDGDEQSPHRELNELALADLAAWVPALGLYRCRRTKCGFEAVPIWRPSTTGRALEKRHLNLKIVPEGIRDFGADQGYTPLDLVMAAQNCDLQTAWQFLSSRLGFAPEHSAIDLQITSAQPETLASNLIDALEPLTKVPGAIGDIV